MTNPNVGFQPKAPTVPTPSSFTIDPSQGNDEEFTIAEGTDDLFINFNPLKPPPQETLVYAPEVEIFIARDNKQYDVTRDIVSVAVQRNENAISTLVFELANKVDPMTNSLRYNQKFERMDRVICRMKRTVWKLVFSGYLDSVPHVQLYPGTVNFRASCTLKRILHTYWDPGLGPSTQVMDQAGILSAQERAGNYSTDTGLGTLLRRFLVEVGGWHPSNIQIQRFPPTYYEFMKREISKTQGVSDANVKEFMTNLLGDDLTLASWKAASTQPGVNEGSFTTGVMTAPERKMEVLRVVDAMGMGPSNIDINASQALTTAAERAGSHADDPQSKNPGEYQPAWKSQQEMGRSWEEAGKKADAAIHCFMCIAVESPGWVMYANNAVPDSLNYPHEAVGHDGTSVGLYQQTEGNGWGSVRQRMNVRESTEMFLTRLNKLNWWNMDRGTAVQSVQRSGFPGRYAEHEQTAIDEVRQLRQNQTPGTGGSPTTGNAGANIPVIGKVPIPPGQAQAAANQVTATATASSPQAAASATGVRPRYDTQGAILYAKSKIGCPYGWGDTGPASFDCVSEGTLITTDRGDVPIEEVTTEDRVLTRKGYRRVLRAWKVRDDAEVMSIWVGGRELTVTPDHRIWTETKGWIAAKGLGPYDKVVSCRIASSKEHALSAARSTWAGRIALIAAVSAGMSQVPMHDVEDWEIASETVSSSTAWLITDTQTQTSHLFGIISSDRVNHYIKRCGNIITAPFQSATRFITSITTPSTTTSPTLPVLRGLSIAAKARRLVGCMATGVRGAMSNSGRLLLRDLSEDSVRFGINRHSTTVYDLMVEDEHEFFANGVLVHNCSGLTMMAYRSIGLEIGRNTHNQLGGNQKIPAAQAKPGDLIFPNGVEHVVMVSDTPGYMIHSPQTGDFVKEAPMPPGYINAPAAHIGGTTWGGPGYSTFDPFPTQLGAPAGTVTNGVDGSVGQTQATEPIARNLFTYMFVTQPPNVNSYLFGSEGEEEKAFMNDQSMLPTVVSICQARLCNFSSAPNGNFQAYYPDYFGMDGKRAVLHLENIEMKNVQIDLNDDMLVTHAYVAGSPQIQNNQFGILGWVMSKGFATVENRWLFEKMRLAAPNVPGEKMRTGKSIMKHFGARPLTKDMPMIQSGPMEFLCAVQLFMEKWAQQYATQIELTFMPELYTGNRIELADTGLSVYVTQVNHSCNFETGFSTTATIMAPALSSFGRMMGNITNPKAQDDTANNDLANNASEWFF